MGAGLDPRRRAIMVAAVLRHRLLSSVRVVSVIIALIHYVHFITIDDDCHNDWITHLPQWMRIIKEICIAAVS